MSQKKLWGGRFQSPTNKLVEAFSGSVHFDHKLAKYDCLGSLYHVGVLLKAKLISSAEHQQLKKGLLGILKQVESGTFKVTGHPEDIHSYIQSLLEKSVGKVALKLHTCRSRNDQVVFDTKLYCLENIRQTVMSLIKLHAVLTGLAKQHKNTVLPGYTHLQHAMPVSLSWHLQAYAEMLARDGARLSNAFNNIELTMGAGALAGTMIPANCYQHKADRYFSKDIGATRNPLDAVSDRDFVIEILSALSVVGMHLSRISEDLILWVSQEFHFISIDDAFCTGSSLMPQKKNPDVLELVRGYTGRLYGNLVNVLVVMKGLPLSYNRDLQHDKQPLFDSFEIVQSSSEVLTEMMQHVHFHPEQMAAQLLDETLFATDIADHLVRQGVAFKQAHGIVGKLVQYKLEKGVSFLDIPEKKLRSFHASLTRSALTKILNPQTSVKGKKSFRHC